MIKITYVLIRGRTVKKAGKVRFALNANGTREKGKVEDAKR